MAINPLNLFEHNKAERRRRIVAAARKLIARRGFDGLTMRELARASRVSVPTLYNLFGGKHAILAAEMEETYGTVVRALHGAVHGDVLDRALAVYQAGTGALVAAPGYYRELSRVFLTTAESTELRRKMDDQYVTAMTANLRAGQAAGEIADWVDAGTLAHHLWLDYMMAVLGWAKGDLDDELLVAVTEFGLCMLLLGVVTGARTLKRVQARARAAQEAIARRSDHATRRA
jgi:AcrR family transcriptional regulator